ncbi:hypothetical protein JCM9140_4051 [Halalkalibacter wakoensis JCM 9140]|uniref:DUF2529 domain-containing protein n=1 Tax=Halalkalibacter wakoensis JCM 9140 TaxID=1236970 RepID=W4Q7E4_9BACI|nr:DUF2529 family protein [Halalkalibacter wakoensis]GAE27885.1 hypothetical protein JCM9140_4051 [Halalkalibacter wakoensis JCM 9140]
MQKIFKTQLTGLLSDPFDEEELEDAARLLTQALVGDGHLYVYGKEEMAAVEAEAVHGKEALSNVYSLFENGKIVDLNSADRVFLLSRNTADSDLLDIVKKLSEKQIPIVGLTVAPTEGQQWTDLVDIHLDLNLTQSLVPTDSGDRIGYPASLLALYTYFCLFLLISEMLTELD